VAAHITVEIAADEAQQRGRGIGADA